MFIKAWFYNIFGAISYSQILRISRIENITQVSIYEYIYHMGGVY